jgi:hypothetical protein
MVLALARLVLRTAIMSLAGALTLAALAGCGGQSSATQTGTRPANGANASDDRAPAATLPSATRQLAPRGALGQTSTSPAAAVRPSAPLSPHVTPIGQPSFGWHPVASVGGHPAVWQAQRSGATLLRFDQRLVRLALHAGLGEPSGNWRYGDQIERSEIHRVAAAFNGGFKFETGVIGFMADGRVAVALQPGLGSIVSYRNGVTAIGAWQQGVPARGRPIASVLQNLQLLVDHGVPAANVESCVQACWGATLGGGTVIARSALGITRGGQLVWAAGASLSPAGIAQGLVEAGVQRAVELDINPEWVAGYLYVHGHGGPSAVPVVPGQVGIPGRFLEPYSRDFFTILVK